MAIDSSIKDDLLKSPVSRAKLEQANMIDKELYQYVKEHLYPEQKKRYRSGWEADVSAFQMSNNPTRFSFNYTLGVVKRNLIYKPLLSLYRTIKE